MTVEIIDNVQTRIASTMRVLVVEDDPAIASFLSRGLREAGYAVDVAADGHEVWRRRARRNTTRRSSI